MTMATEQQSDKSVQHHINCTSTLHYASNRVKANGRQQGLHFLQSQPSSSHGIKRRYTNRLLPIIVRRSPGSEMNSIPTSSFTWTAAYCWKFIVDISRRTNLLWQCEVVLIENQGCVSQPPRLYTPYRTYTV